MTGTRRALLACLAILPPAFAEDHRLLATVGESALPDRMRYEIVVEQDLDQPDMATIAVAGRAGRRFAGGVHAGDDAKVEAAAGAVFKGEVVSVEPANDRSGVWTVIRALNRLHRLTGEPKTRDFADVTDAEIVEVIAREHSLVPDASGDVQIRYDHVYQQNQTDLEFLRARAARIGYEVLVDDTTLLFRKREDPPLVGLARRPAPDQARLRRFHARLSSTGTLQQVIAHGFDPDRHEITGKAALPTVLLVPGGSDPNVVLGRTLEFVVDSPIFSVEEASAIAKAKLDELSLSYVSSEAEGIGHPSLRAGILVTMSGLGGQFDGQYHVTAARHHYSHGQICGGYKTALRLRRHDEGLFFLPEIDDEVLVAFVGGDITRPFVVGSLWDDDPDCRDRPPSP
jgi:Bacteriophage probable baseplate hub protein